MNTVETNLNITEQPQPSKRGSIFQRLRRRFTLVFRRRNVRKRTKSASEVVEKQENSPNAEEKAKLRLSLSHEPPKDIVCEVDDKEDSVKEMETNFRPPAKVPIFLNDFTSELKQSLKLRSRKIEDGEKSPTEAIKQIEVLRTLSCISDDAKFDVKIDVESKTFEEKLALFESQISGGSESVHDTLKRNKSEHGDTKEDEEEKEKDGSTEEIRQRHSGEVEENEEGNKNVNKINECEKQHDEHGENVQEKKGKEICVQSNDRGNKVKSSEKYREDEEISNKMKESKEKDEEHGGNVEENKFHQKEKSDEICDDKYKMKVETNEKNDEEVNIVKSEIQNIATSDNITSKVSDDDQDQNSSSSTPKEEGSISRIINEDYVMNKTEKCVLKEVNEEESLTNGKISTIGVYQSKECVHHNSASKYQSEDGVPSSQSVATTDDTTTAFNM